MKGREKEKEGRRGRKGGEGEGKKEGKGGRKKKERREVKPEREEGIMDGPSQVVAHITEVSPPTPRYPFLSYLTMWGQLRLLGRHHQNGCQTPHFSQ